MENHPIPQDVTGFQFKLIGEMTVKQFAYLAGGVVIAWATFALPLPWFIKFPVVFLSAGLGVCLAFVPIEGRPFDVMLINFLKTFVTPTQFIFQKSGYTLLPEVQVIPKAVAQTKPEDEKAKLSEKNLQKYLDSLPKTPRNSLDEKEMRFLGTLPLQQQGVSTPQPTTTLHAVNIISQPPIAQKREEKSVQTVTLAAQPVVQNGGLPHLITMDTPGQAAQNNASSLPEPENELEKDEVKNETLEKEAALIQQELAQAKQVETQQQNTPTQGVAHEKVVELQKELADILAQKETLQNQLITLKKQLAMQKQQVFTPMVAQTPVKQQTQNVRIVPAGMAKSVGLPITPDVPNLLTGIVKDARGNTLPNILVEVKDTDGNPVRAFKTNGLGQFAAATPLANGTYTVTFEDPQGKQKFDTIELPVNGMIIQPIEVISADEREQLRKELFT